MEKYSEVLEDMIMRKWHKFIYGEEQERNKYLKGLAKNILFKRKKNDR